jgi:two-component system, NtrC family, response regulator
MASDASAQPSKPRLLVVEDDDATRTQMKWALAHEYDVVLAEDRPSALNALKSERPSVVTLDLGLPPRPGEVEEGFLALSEILQVDPFAKVIIVTGQHEKENGLKAIGEGAYDFFSKPIDIEELKIVLNRAFHVSGLERENHALQQQCSGVSFEGMLGTSPQMEGIFGAIKKVAPTEAPVLILGESGTGKELVANAIHRLSARKTQSLVVINCGAIPENLIESELFGHEKGSFTGAHVQRKGRFEMAQKGTLFLDEIGDLPLPLQVKLLRFLQEQKIERIGGREEILVDARIIAATNKDLKKALATGSFREDLYYRLGVVVISLPPLRDREGDTIVIAMALLQRYAGEIKKKVTGFTRAAMLALKNHQWPGNVRELENRIRRAVIMAQGSRVTPEDLELDSRSERYEGRGLREAREDLEKDMIQKALTRHKGSITQAAMELGVSRPTLYELMEKLAIGRAG